MTRQDAAAQRVQLEARLRSDGDHDLADKLATCGQPICLRCLDCGYTHASQTRCDNKWCPSCMQGLAAERSERIAFAVRRFKWPLFVTLTMDNVHDLTFDAVKHLRQSFGRLRNRRVWKEKVRGGVATIEVTNIGNGWHPHLHAVIDCEWLAVKTDRLRSSDTAAEKQAKINAAGAEFRAAWRQSLKQGTDPVLKVKRCDIGVTAEVVKYAVKPGDLIRSPDPPGPMIRCLMATRLLTTFGSCYKLASQIEAAEGEAPPFTCPNGHASWMPDELVTAILSNPRNSLPSAAGEKKPKPRPQTKRQLRTAADARKLARLLDIERQRTANSAP